MMKLAVLFSSAVSMAAAINPYGTWKRMESDVKGLLNTYAADWDLESQDAGAAEPITLHFHFALSEEAKQQLHDTLMDVSDPRRVYTYGKHLNNIELARLVGASDDAIELVRDWLVSQGVDESAELSLNPTRDVFSLNTHVAVAENLLNTDIVAFRHSKAGVRLLRAANAYHLPERIADVVSIVSDLARLPSIRTTIKAQPVQGSGTWANDCSVSSCKGLVTPGVIRTRYAVDTTATETASSNSMAVAEFQLQYYNPKSLNEFSTACHVDSTPAQTIGGNIPVLQGVEAILDIEYIKVTAPEVPLTVWYSGTYSLLNWATAVNDMATPIWVWSVSYGNDEAQQTGVAYMEQCSVQFQKAGVKGISLLFASGDQGTCGREGCGILRKVFHPDFPAANPFITAVGGTDFLTNSIGEETTWSQGGGGFSNTFGIPDWQADVVANYKKIATLPTASAWNNTGRGYPDISALGGQKNPYCVATSATAFQGVAGTSASAPVVAGIFAKLNGLRLAAGKSPLGWLNPLIYQNGDAFNDVTTGNNGFPAAKGWDPATGFGTPNYEALAKIVSSLP